MSSRGGAVRRLALPAAGEGVAGRLSSPSIRRERGAALLIALFVLLLLGISLALLALTMRIGLEEQRREIRRTRLDLALDAVVAETLGRLAIDPTFAGVARRRDGAAEGWSEVERRGPTEASLRATVVLGSRRGVAEARVRLAPGPPRVVSWRRGPLAAAGQRR